MIVRLVMARRSARILPGSSSRFSFLRRLSLRLTYRIAILGLIGLAGVILVGSMHTYTESVIGAHRRTVETARGIFDLNNKIQIELLEARRAEKDFLLRNDKSKAEVQSELVKAAGADINAIRERLAAIGKNELVRKIDIIVEALKNYESNFKAVVEDKLKLGIEEKSGLEGKLLDAARDLESKVSQRSQANLANLFLTMRRHEKDFMLWRDEKYADLLKTAAKTFISEVEDADIPEASKTELKQKLSNYQTAFFAWLDMAMNLADDLRAASVVFTKIEPVIADVSKAVNNVSTEADRADMQIRNEFDWLMNIAIAAVALSVSIIGLWIGRSISKPLKGMIAAMTRLAAGNFDVDLPGLNRADEVGEMARTVEVFRREMIETNRLRSEQAETEQRQMQQRKIDMRRFADSFEEAVGEIIDTVSRASDELKMSAGRLATTAERTQDLTGNVARASEEASGNVQLVAAATEELSSSVAEIGRRAQDSALMANEAVGQARATNDRVSKLSKAAGRIGDVVDLINSIAGQTNLLALNATIEAARAGEAGRGFSVVASEVKALAEQTAKATGEIGHQVAGIQAATEQSVVSIQSITTTIEKLSEASNSIASAVEEQGAATRDISRNVQCAAEGTLHVSSNVVDVKRGATETGSASSQLLMAAQSLSDDSGRLKREVDKFLSNVRAA